LTTKLTNLLVKEVSFVDEGANEDAKIILFKRQTPKEGFKTEHGVQYPMKDYAYVGDPAHPKSWKLRLTSSPGGDVDPNVVGAALAALGPNGFRGNPVQIPAKDLPGVKDKVLAAWKKLHPDEENIPEILKRTGEIEMTPEEVQAMIDNAMADVKAMIEGMGKMEDKPPTPPEEVMPPAAKMEDEPPTPPEEDEEMDKELAKRFTAQDEEIKKQNDLINVQAQVIAKMKEQTELADIAKRVSATMGNLPGEADDIAKSIHDIAKAAPDAAKKIEELLIAGNAAMAKSLGHEAGGAGSEDIADAYEQLVAKADVIEKEEKVTKAKAFVLAKNRNPDLWAAQRKSK